MDNQMLPTPLGRQANTFAGKSLQVLKTMILDGTLHPGQRLNEVELARALGISRGPLREAVQRLASDGLVTIISHRGAFVRAFDTEELVELYELRTALETHAVRLAARRVDTEDLVDLDEMLRVTEDVLASAGQHAYPSDLDFHQRVVSLAGNQTLLRAAVEVNHQIQLARSRSAQQPQRARNAFVEHRDILTALARADGSGAADLLATHLQHSLTNALQLLRCDPPEDVSGLTTTKEHHS